MDLNHYIIRKAKAEDIPFIVDTIVEAERGGTNRLGLANLFELTEADLRNFLCSALEEEIDGCEFSLSSYVVAECNGDVVSCFGGWIEGDNEDGMSSSLLKSSILSYFLPQESINASVKNAEAVKQIQIEREAGSYELEYSWTIPDHRNKGILSQIIKEHERYARKKNVRKMQVHVFDNNIAAINSYQKNGFVIIKEYKSDHPMTSILFPSSTLLLLEKYLKY